MTDSIDKAIDQSQRVEMRQVRLALNRPDGSTRPIVFALPADLQPTDVIAVIESCAAFCREVMASAERARPSLLIAHGALPKPS